MQVSSFTARGLKAAFVSAEDCDKEVIKCIHRGEYQLVLISPESIISNLYWREMLRTQVYQQNLVAFAVDEAHCVSKWLVGTYLLWEMCNSGFVLCITVYDFWFLTEFFTSIIIKCQCCDYSAVVVFSAHQCIHTCFCILFHQGCILQERIFKIR